jgi:uncharacterized protein (DUF4415 family)
MQKHKNITSYTAAELEAGRAHSRTDWHKVDSLTDAELEKLVAEDEDERSLRPDWTQARLVLPQAKQSVHLRLDKEVIAFFKASGKGYITRMQAVLKAYADAHRKSGER